MTDRRGWAVWLASKLPEPLLASPERVALNIGAITIGSAAMVPPPGSIIDGMSPEWMGYTLGLIFIMGGLFSLHATWTGTRWTERVGSLGYALACLIYVQEIVDQAGWSGTGAIVIFTVIMLSKLLRWLRSTAFDQSDGSLGGRH